MNKIIAANLKMNLTSEEIRKYKEVMEGANIENLIIFPTSIHLPLLLSDKYEVGLQNGYYIDSGAYTGETSFRQLKELGVNYSLIGHSERRNIFGETNEEVSLKLNSCIDNNVLGILCVGENLEDRKNGNTLKVIDECLSVIPYDKLNEIIIAYEPVWAIGTGLIPTLEEIKEVHLHIKELIKKSNTNVKVLYGGSVNLSNIKEICSIDEVDGVLIGGASNDPYNLIKMYNEIK